MVHHKLPCGNKRFFICQRDILSGSYRGKRRLQPNIPNNRCNNSLHAVQRCCGFQTFHTSANPDICISKPAFQQLRFFPIHHCYKLWSKFPSLFFQQVNILITGNRRNADVAKLLYNLQCLRTDRAC